MKKMIKKVVALAIMATIGITTPAFAYAGEAEKTEQIQDNQKNVKTEGKDFGVQQETEEDNYPLQGCNEEKQTGDKKNIIEPDADEAQTGKAQADRTTADSTESDNTEQVQEQEMSEKTDENVERIVSVKYEAHMQNLGWISEKRDGETAGEAAGSNHMEAIKICVEQDEEQKLNGSIIYQTHVSDMGWQNEVKNGQEAGTTGKNKAVEAVKIRLTGQLKDNYDVYYRVSSEKKGWFGWAKNGELAGSVGFGYGVKAIEVKLVRKDVQDKPVQDVSSYLVQSNVAKLVYQTHVKNIGWQNEVHDGQEAGTIGQVLSVEAIKISIDQPTIQEERITGSVIYQTHVRDIGWQNEVCDGKSAGTTGQKKPIEGIKIRLKGEITEKYDIYYRVHVSDYGWLGWAKNGELAGSTGYGCAIEAIKIILCEKGSAPADEGRSGFTSENIAKINCQTHLENLGWQAEVSSDNIIGTVGQNRSIEALRMSVASAGNKFEGGISYKLHVANIGWQNWSANGAIAGTTGQGRQAEAIQMKLTGEMASYCDIYYRAHVSEFGWLGWAKNGESAGTSGYAYKLQAIQIKIVPKGMNNPSNGTVAFKNAPPKPVYTPMQMRANLYSSSTPYLILVNRSTHRVEIYQGWRGNWNTIAQWSCSDGAPGTPTVEGTFRVGSKGYYFDSGASRCYWYTQFYGNYLFHSVLYNKNGTLRDGRLGMALSHGCVRLNINNAKWIYDHIPQGTTVVVYH